MSTALKNDEIIHKHGIGTYSHIPLRCCYPRFRKQPENFEQGPVASPSGDQILVRDAIAGILFHVKEVMTKLVLETVMAQRKRVDNRLSAALNSLI